MTPLGFEPRFTRIYVRIVITQPTCSVFWNNIFLYFSRHLRNARKFDTLLYVKAVPCLSKLRFWGHYIRQGKDTLRSTGKYCVTERQTQISAYFSSLTLHAAVHSTVWPLLGWRRNGQGILRLCQKHLLWREHMIAQCDAASHYQTARKIDKAREIAHQTSHRSIVQMELKSLWVMQCFWNGEKTAGAACAELPPLLACHFNPAPTVIKFTAYTNTASHLESITHTVNSRS